MAVLLRVEVMMVVVVAVMTISRGEKERKMAGKPNTKNKWNDVQTVLAATAMTLTLGLWNLFAGPDRSKVEAQAAQPTPEPVQEATEEPAEVPVVPTVMPPGMKITFVGPTVASEATVVAQQQPQAQPDKKKKKKNSGGGGSVTTTQSS